MKVYSQRPPIDSGQVEKNNDLTKPNRKETAHRCNLLGFLVLVVIVLVVITVVKTLGNHKTPTEHANSQKQILGLRDDSPGATDLADTQKLDLGLRTIGITLFTLRSHEGCGGRNELGTIEGETVESCAQRCLEATGSCVSFEFGLANGLYPGRCQLSSTCGGSLASYATEFDFYELGITLFTSRPHEGCGGRNELGTIEGETAESCAQRCLEASGLCVSFEIGLTNGMYPGRCQLSSTCGGSLASFATEFDFYELGTTAFTLIPHEGCAGRNELGTTEGQTAESCAQRCLEATGLCISFEIGLANGLYPGRCQLSYSCSGSLASYSTEFDFYERKLVYVKLSYVGGLVGIGVILIAVVVKRRRR